MDGTTCSALQDVKLSTDSDAGPTEKAWVNSRVTKIANCDNLDIECRIENGRKVPLSLEGSSSTFEGLGPQNTLTPEGYWHSAGPEKAWLALKMSRVENEVIVVEVDDRQDVEDGGSLHRYQIKRLKSV